MGAQRTLPGSVELSLSGCSILRPALHQWLLGALPLLLQEAPTWQTCKEGVPVAPCPEELNDSRVRCFAGYRLPGLREGVEFEVICIAGNVPLKIAMTSSVQCNLQYRTVAHWGTRRLLRSLALPYTQLALRPNLQCPVFYSLSPSCLGAQECRWEAWRVPHHQSLQEKAHLLALRMGLG